MDLKERRQIFYSKARSDAPLCVNCRHFVRYYYMDKARYFQPLHFGHCILEARPRRKMAYDECEEFLKKK